MTDHSTDTQTSVGEVRIGDHYFPVVNGQVSQLNLNRWPPKVTFGDYTQDSDPLVSAQILSSFVGGIGNYRVKAGVDDDSYWTGTLESRYPEGLTLLPYTDSFTVEGNEDPAYPLGDFPASNPVLLVAFGDVLYQWDYDAQEFVLVDTLPASPVMWGVEFDGEYYVPLGANGYVVVDGSLAVTPATDLEPIQFIVWDKKLCALCEDGNFYFMAVGGTWSAQSDDRKLPTGNLPRKMVNFINASGEPALHIVSNSLVFAFDPQGGTDGLLYETRLDYPRHPDQGRGAANWRGDQMFVSVGLGIHGYNGSVITSMGPDGRYGLPAHLRGTIVDLLPEYNALLALVKGRPDDTLEVAAEEYLAQAPLYQNQDTWAISNYPYRPVSGCLLRWSNSQWHPAWESEGAIGEPTWMCLSEAGEYRLWWGYGPNVYTQPLPVSFQNPKQSLLSQSSQFAPNGSLITGWFDADMTAFEKLSSHAEIVLDDVTGNNDPGGRVALSYQINTDNEGSWRPMGEATTVGVTSMTFGNIPREVGDDFSKGRAQSQIRYKFDFYQRVTTAPPDESEEGAALRILSDRKISPLMSAAIMKFQKVPYSQLSWQFTIDLTTQDGFKSVGNRTLGEYLDSLLNGNEFVEFGFLDRVFRVRIAQESSGLRTGYDERGNYQINLVEVRDSRQGSVVVRVDQYGA